MPKSFNKEAVHDSQITPLMEQIIAICKKHKIPMLATFNYARLAKDGGTDMMCTTCLDGVNGYQPPAMLKALNVIRNCTAEFAAFTITTSKEKP